MRPLHTANDYADFGSQTGGRLRCGRIEIKIHPLPLDRIRAALQLGVDGPDILAKNAEKDQLQRAG